MDQNFQKENAHFVVADDRERPSGVIELLTATEGVSVEVRRLKLGDFDVDRRLLIERKTTTDFALSVIDGRLFRQCYSLMTSGRRTCLILEGPLSNIRISREALQGAMVTVTLIFGQPVLRSKAPAETAKLMLVAAEQLLRSEAPHRGRHIRMKGRRRRRIQSKMLQAIPGLGPKKAGALISHLGDFRNIVLADLDALMKIPGIGRGIATRILWALGNHP